MRREVRWNLYFWPGSSSSRFCAGSWRKTRVAAFGAGWRSASCSAFPAAQSAGGGDKTPPAGAGRARRRQPDDGRVSCARCPAEAPRQPLVASTEPALRLSAAGATIDLWPQSFSIATPAAITSPPDWRTPARQPSAPRKS